MPINRTSDLPESNLPTNPRTLSRTSKLTSYPLKYLCWYFRGFQDGRGWSSGKRGPQRPIQLIVGSNQADSQRLFSNWLGGQITSPRVHKELLSNWFGDWVIPLREILASLFFRNFLIVFFFSVFVASFYNFPLAKKKNGIMAVLWCNILSFVIRVKF